MFRHLSRFVTARPPLWFMVLAALVLANLLRNWGGSLLDRHEFRQTQTALTAYWLREDGWRLDYPLPVFGPPWSAPMEFPLYQVMVAGVAKLGGCSIESAGRAVAIAAFFLTLPALAGLLASAGFPARARWIALASVLLTPVYLFYGRALLIESTALCCALWFLHAFVHGLAAERGRWRWTAAAALLGALAAVVKITTFVPVCLIAGAWTLVALARRRKETNAQGAARSWPDLLAAAVLPAMAAVAAGWWWVRYSDAVKAVNPLAVRLQSANLSAWNFGTLAQRLDPASWHIFALQTGYTTCGLVVGGIALGAAFFAPRRYRLAALAGAAAFMVGPLCFFNLYLVHDYYFCANAVFLSAGLGLLIAGLWENPRVPRVAALVVALLIGGWQIHGFVCGLGIYLANPPSAPPVLAAAIREVVPADAVVLLVNRGWNPQLPFSMQRRAIMLPDGFHNDIAALAEVTGRLAPGALRAFVWRGADSIPVELYTFVFEELGFSPEAVATDGENTLFLRPEERSSARARLAELALPGLHFSAPALVSTPAAAEFKVFSAPIAEDNPLCRPAPLAGRSLYGLSIGRNGELPCIVAHAPSRLTVAPPAGATAIELTYGLADECREPDTRSDGVVVTVFSAVPGRPRQALFCRTLDPVGNPADRGVQTVRIALPRDLGAPLELDVSMGVTGNLSFDWFYWYRIAVQ